MFIWISILIYSIFVIKQFIDLNKLFDDLEAAGFDLNFEKNLKRIGMTKTQLERKIKHAIANDEVIEAKFSAFDTVIDVHQSFGSLEANIQLSKDGELLYEEEIVVNDYSVPEEGYHLLAKKIMDRSPDMIKNANKARV